MSEQNQGQQQQQAQRRVDYPAPFTVEFGNDYCQNFMLTTPPLQMIVRGAFSIARMARRPTGMRDLGSLASRIPDLPGARLTVNPRKGEIKLYDPCFTDKDGQEQLARYNAVAKQNPFGLNEYRALDTIEHKLDEDQMKTLLLELLRKKASECITVIDGQLPTAKDIDAMPGDELYDPSDSSTDKPKYKKDLQKHRDRLRAAGVI